MNRPDFRLLRRAMVEQQLIARGITERNILAAFGNVPRERFVPEQSRLRSYEDCPLAIGYGQTISQPYIAALMTQLLSVQPGDTVLEIGTGSGYQSAILAYLKAKVYSVERIALLADSADVCLKEMGYTVMIRRGDGTEGWSEHAPYTKIIVTAAADSIPVALKEQLAFGGKMIFPLGGPFRQDLTLVKKISLNRLKQETVCGCIFVPLIGAHGVKN